jgi:putative DNA primase/helicase
MSEAIDFPSTEEIAGQSIGGQSITLQLTDADRIRFEEKYSEDSKAIAMMLIAQHPGDSYNADVAALVIRGKFLFDCEHGVWYRYREDDGLFVEDKESLIVERTREAILSIYQIACRLKEEENRKAWILHAVRSDCIFKIKAAVALNECRPEFVVRSSIWDRDLDVIKVKNGLIKLSTGEFVPFDPATFRDYYFTKQADADYIADAVCPRWEKFILEIFDSDLAEYVCRLAGLCLTGEITEQKFWILFGQGDNGKSVLYNTLVAILADYAVEIDTDVLMDSGRGPDGNAASPGLTRIIGKRLVVAPESKAGQTLNQGLLKRLTGGESISCRELYKKGFDFMPVCKIWFPTNHRPKVPNGGRSLWRRLRLIPFNKIIPASKQDKKLFENLKSEYSGILNWMLAGLARYRADGLPDIVPIEAATTGYRDAQDTLKSFLDDALKSYVNGKLPAGEIYQKYTAWSKENGEFVLPGHIFIEAMGERGWIYKHRGDGRWYIRQVEEVTG